MWEGDAFQAVLPDADLSDPSNALIIGNLIVDLGVTEDGDPATLRAEIQFEDLGGDVASSSVIFTENVAGLNISFPLGGLTGDILPPDPAVSLPGQPLPGAAGAAGVIQGGAIELNPLLNFDELVRVEICFLDDPLNGAAFGSFVPGAGLLPAEALADGGTDLSADFIRFDSEEENGGNFNIAETETFAQVTPDGSYAFSDLLAAFSGAVLADALI